MEIEQKERERIEKAALKKYSDGVRGRGDWMGKHQIEGFIEGGQSEHEHLQKEVIQPMQSVMIAAAEEIMRVWPAHCDEKGYGPSNLMHRLEKGIPSQYGYTAGAFAKLEAEIKALRELMGEVRRTFGNDTMVVQILPEKDSYYTPTWLKKIDQLLKNEG